MKNSRIRQRLLLVLMAGLLVVIAAVIIMTGQKKSEIPKVGLIITGTVSDSGWNGVHYQGVAYACDKLGAKLLVKENVPEEEEACEKAICELVEGGASMIILSSYAYPGKVKEVIQRYPEVAFYGSSAEYYTDNMTSYFGRMYQARYLAGIIAGMQTKSNSIGYVAAMSNIEVNRGINAFTLGAKSVNSEAVVNVIWTGDWDNKENEIAATNKLINDKNIDVVTYHQNCHYVAETADAAGIYSIGYNKEVEYLSDKYLTAAVWNWKALYYEIVREFILGKANSVKRHWFGIDTGVVGLSEYSSDVSEEVRQAVDAARNAILEGKSVFSGTIFDNNGNLRCDDGESISDEQLLEKLDWYVDGVVIYE